MFAALDADLLAVIPAFSRHPSLKNLMLGKNFNIKGRYGPRREPAVQMVLETIIRMMNVFLFSPPPQGVGWNSAETSSFGARGRVCELNYVTYCTHAHTRTFDVVLWANARLRVQAFTHFRMRALFFCLLLHVQLKCKEGENMHRHNFVCVSSKGFIWSVYLQGFLCSAYPAWQVAFLIINYCWWWSLKTMLSCMHVHNHIYRITQWSKFVSRMEFHHVSLILAVLSIHQVSHDNANIIIICVCLLWSCYPVSHGSSSVWVTECCWHDKWEFPSVKWYTVHQIQKKD